MPTRTHREFTVSRPPELMAVNEAARRLCVTTQTVRNWYYAGTLTGIKIGTRIKLHADGVYALLNPQTHKGI